jgi:hypothetical protein
LELVAARGRPNTLLAHAYDLKVFFTVIDRDPVDVAPADVLAFIAEQRLPRRASNVVRIEDGERRRRGYRAPHLELHRARVSTRRRPLLTPDLILSGAPVVPGADARSQRGGDFSTPRSDPECCVPVDDGHGRFDVLTESIRTRGGVDSGSFDMLQPSSPDEERGG